MTNKKAQTAQQNAILRKARWHKALAAVTLPAVLTALGISQPNATPCPYCQSQSFTLDLAAEQFHCKACKKKGGKLQPGKFLHHL